MSEDVLPLNETADEGVTQLVTAEEIAQIRAEVNALKLDQRAARPPQKSARVLRRRSEAAPGKRYRQKRKDARAARKRNRG